ncbi:MAG: 2-isopropylmalate synthase [Candidatus Bathyarchaeia archaeon]|nr:2-isopropylmalate synthase [Candidatus Bathyarchaeota archaeon]
MQSTYNFLILRFEKWGIALFGRESRFAEKIRIFDTTLRDGEQTPGVSLTPEKKVLIARKLDELGVDIIEAGFAAASEGERKAIKLITKEKIRAEICSFARGLKDDIDAALKCDVDSVFLVIPASDIQIRSKLQKNREEVLRMVEESVEYAKAHGLIVEFGPEDSTRSDMSFLKQMIKTALSAGADRITPPDTVGILTPERAYQFFSELKTAFPGTVFGVHCHDDFGLAVANTLAALMAGATIAHVTINGLGERAGNAALEEVVIALKLQYNVDIPIRTELLYETSLLVSRLTGVPTQPNKAIIGENAFTHESGIHTHAILVDPSSYEPIPPEIVGRVRRIVVGKHAGIHGIRAALMEMGINPTEEHLKEIFRRVKELGDKGKRVTDADLKAIAEAVMGIPSAQPIRLEELTVITGNRVTPTASVKLNVNNRVIVEAATGVGPVDAAMNAIRKAVSAIEPIHLEEYHVKAITGGTDAVVEVIVRLRKGDRIITAMGVHEDIVMASVNAMMSGINVLVDNRSRMSQNSKIVEQDF